MKMNWYYRMMLSYTPIFFVVISSIIFIFFLMLNRDAENQYIDTNQAILERMVHNTDVNLMLIERNVVSQLLKDRAIQSFFTGAPKSVFDYYEIQNKLIELKSSFPFQNAIYLYHESGGRVLSESGSYSLEAFEDRDYLLASYGQDVPGGWSAPRSFAQLASDDKQQVVSLVKFYFNGDTRLGAVVVNAYLSNIMEYLNSFSDSGIQLLPFGDAAPASADPEVESSSILVTSMYTGWQYAAEGWNQPRYNALSLFSSAWMMSVVVVIVLALIGFTLVTHLHYKPIQAIVRKVGRDSSLKREKLGIKQTKNEITYIETALDYLLKKSVDYESLYKEDSQLRQQQLYHDLLSGQRQLSDKQFAEQLKAWDIPHRYDRLGVIAVEIDDYPGFAVKYVLRDQHLLKFILENAFHDLGQQNRLFVWHAWMGPDRIAFVAHFRDDEPTGAASIAELAVQFHRWIQDNLELTVTIGIGEDAVSIAAIADAYRGAQDHVDLKPVFGADTIIDSRRSAGKLGLNRFVYLQALESAAQSFRLHESDWREKLADIFGQLKEMRFSKSEMRVFVNGFATRLDKAVSTLSPAVQERWLADFRPAWESLPDRTETLDELERRIMAAMSDFEAVLDQDRQARRHHHLALQAKSYIDDNYTNPDLSLTLVSEHLKLQPTTLSQIFKEELGEKFVDYVLKARLEHAKRLLKETGDSVQSIAEQVGYRNVISFYRVFRRVHDVPPGEYRNQVQREVGS